MLSRKKIATMSFFTLFVALISVAVFIVHHNNDNRRRQEATDRAAVVTAQRNATNAIADFRPQIIKKDQELYDKGLRGKALAEALKPEEDAISKRTMATIEESNEVLYKAAMRRRHNH